MIDDYFEAIHKQLLFELHRFSVSKQSISTIYFGGGTPSSVEAYKYDKLLETLRPYLQDNSEITFEANPNSASKEWLEHIFSLGANRLSLGVQSFDTKKLEFLGRIHDSNQAKNAVITAHDVGFEDISLDIIYDTPYDSDSFVESEIKEALKLPINHLSAYSLTIEDDSAFRGKYSYKSENLRSAEVIFSILRESGFEHYEVSNFGKKRSAHNAAYWMSKDYMGIGAGAVGFLKNQRFYPSKETKKYIENPTQYEHETMSADELRFERVFLGLRSFVGVSLDDIKPNASERVEELVRHNKVVQKNERLMASDFLLADEIALYLES